MLDSKPRTICYHSMGFAFAYPLGWVVQKTDLGLILTPPDCQVHSNGIAESYVIMGEAASGITSPASPQAVQHLDDLISSQMPSLTRAGGADRVKCRCGDGFVFHWQGSSDDPIDLVAQAYLCITGDLVVTLLATGPGQAVMNRQETLLAIFVSLRPLKPEDKKTFCSSKRCSTRISHTISHVEG